MSKMNNYEKYAGMTVNERLYESGLLKEFDQARKAKDRDKMIQLLILTELTSKQAKETVDSILE